MLLYVYRCFGLLAAYFTVDAYAQCSSTNRTIYLKLNKAELKSSSGVGDLSSSATFDQCSKKCTEATTSSCNSFNYNRESQLCSLRTESAQPFGSGLLAPSQGSFYQKICVQSDQVCNVSPFDWYPQYVLVGYSMEVLTSSSTSECLQLCLEFAAVNKICKSVMYFHDTRECVINAESRTSRPDLFNNDTQGYIVDYFDNNCARGSNLRSTASTPITCTQPAIAQYTIVENQQLQGPHVDSVVSVASVDVAKCQSLCDRNQDNQGQPVACRGYSYDKLSQICYLNADLSAPRGESSFVERQNFNYYEKVCLSYGQMCSGQISFNRYPDHVLVGYAREVYRYSNVADCLDACLNAKTSSGFDCLSAMFYFDTGECIINSATRNNQPELFSGDTQALAADYFENNCVHRGYAQPPVVTEGPSYQSVPSYQSPPAYQSPSYPGTTSYVPAGPAVTRSPGDTYDAFSTLPAPGPPASPGPYILSQPDIPAPLPPNVVLPPNEVESHTVRFVTIPNAVGTIPPPPPEPNDEPSFPDVPRLPAVSPSSSFKTEHRQGVLAQTSTEPETHIFIIPATEIPQLNGGPQLSAGTPLTSGPQLNAKPQLVAGSQSKTNFQSTKISIATECLLDSIRVLASFPQKISGAIFLKNQFSTCRKLFDNVASVVFDIPLHSTSTVQKRQASKSTVTDLCEASLVGLNKYSWVLVVQKNEMGVPGLMTAEDQIYNVTCDYAEAAQQKVSADKSASLPSVRLPAQELDSPAIPKIDAKISMELLRDGIPVTTVLLGEEMELRWLIETTTPNIAFFVHECSAERVGGLPPEPAPLRLITEGCPDARIAGRIMPSAVVQLKNGLSTRMTMFRFDGSRSVKIKCAIDMCSQRCRPVKCLLKNQQVDSLGRKKRNTLEVNPLTKQQQLVANNSEHLNASFKKQNAIIDGDAAVQSTIVGIFTIVDELPNGPGGAKNIDLKKRGKSLIEKTDKGAPGSVLMQNGQICLLKPLFVGLFTFLAILCVVECAIVVVYVWKKYAEYKSSSSNSNNEQDRRTSPAGSVHSSDGLLRDNGQAKELRRRIFGLRKDSSYTDDILNDRSSRASDAMSSRKSDQSTGGKPQADKVEQATKTEASALKNQLVIANVSSHQRRHSNLIVSHDLRVDDTLDVVGNFSSTEYTFANSILHLNPSGKSKCKNGKKTEDSESNSSSSIDCPTYMKFAVVPYRTSVDDFFDTDQPPNESPPSVPHKKKHQPPKYANSTIFPPKRVQSAECRIQKNVKAFVRDLNESSLVSSSSFVK